MRVLFTWLGGVTATAALVFIVVAVWSFWPLKTRRQWALAAMQLLWPLAGLSNGARVAKLNLSAIDTPLNFVNSGDEVVAIASMVISALAALVGLVVYLLYRAWPEK